MRSACPACVHPDGCRIALPYAVFRLFRRKLLTRQLILRYKPCLHSNVLCGEVAQLGEHRLRKAGAGSSSLLFSTTASKRVATHVATLFLSFCMGHAARCLARSPARQRLVSGGMPCPRSRPARALPLTQVCFTPLRRRQQGCRRLPPPCSVGRRPEMFLFSSIR